MSIEGAHSNHPNNPLQGEQMSEQHEFSELLLKLKQRLKEKEGLKFGDRGYEERLQSLAAVLDEAGLYGADRDRASGYLAEVMLQKYINPSERLERITPEEVGATPPEKTEKLEPILGIVPDSNPLLPQRPKRERASKKKTKEVSDELPLNDLKKTKSKRREREANVSVTLPELTPGQRAYQEEVHKREYWWEKDNN